SRYGSSAGLLREGKDVLPNRSPGLLPDLVELVEEAGEEAVGTQLSDVESRMLKAVSPVEVRRHDHLVVEAVDGVVEVHVVVADLHAEQRLQGLQVAERHVDAGRQGAVQVFQGIPIEDLLALGVGHRDAHPAATGAALLDDLRKVDVLLTKEQEGVT